MAPSDPEIATLILSHNLVSNARARFTETVSPTTNPYLGSVPRSLRTILLRGVATDVAIAYDGSSV